MTTPNQHRCENCPSIEAVVQAAMNDEPQPHCVNDTEAVTAARVAAERRKAATEQARIEQILADLERPPTAEPATVGLAHVGEFFAKAFAGEPTLDPPDAA